MNNLLNDLTISDRDYTEDDNYVEHDNNLNELIEYEYDDEDDLNDILEFQSNEVIANLNISFTYIYDFRLSLEILKCLTESEYIYFNEEEIYINYADQNNGLEIIYRFPVNKLLFYQIKDVSTGISRNDLFKKYDIYAKISLESLVCTLKTVKKSDILKINADILSNGKIKNIRIMKNSAVDNIECEIEDINDIYRCADILNTYYDVNKPTIKTTVFKFKNFIDCFKAKKCHNAIFRKQSNGSVSIEGYNGNKIVTIFIFYNNGSSDTVNSDSININDDIECLDEDYIEINFKSIDNWILKITKMSDKNSIVSLFIGKSNTIIIRTNIGDIGVSTFAFSNNKYIET